MGRDPLMIWGARSDALYGLVNTMQHGWERHRPHPRADPLPARRARPDHSRRSRRCRPPPGCRPATAPPTTRRLAPAAARQAGPQRLATTSPPSSATQPRRCPPARRRSRAASGALVTRGRQGVERAASQPLRTKGFMPIFSSPAFEDHEALHAFYDGPAGLKCLIAIHSTARGPAGGGVPDVALSGRPGGDRRCARLSRAMSHKNAMAELELGGGKTVIIGDPARDKTPALFEALGRAVERLGGRYWAAEDVGVSPADLAYARKETRFVAGLEGHPAASGDPSPGHRRGRQARHRALRASARSGAIAERRRRWRSRASATSARSSPTSWPPTGAKLIDLRRQRGAGRGGRRAHRGPAGRHGRDLRRAVRCLRPLRARRGDLGADAAAAEGEDRRRRRQQPAGRQGDRPGPVRPRPHLRAGLRHQRRRHHQHRRRDPRAGSRRLPTIRPGWR